MSQHMGNRLFKSSPTTCFNPNPTLLGKFRPLVQLLLKIVLANLFQKVRIPGLVDFESLAAVRADDFMHGHSTPSALNTASTGSE